MSDRPEAEAIRIRIFKIQHLMPKDAPVWYAYFHMYQVNKQSVMGLHFHRAGLALPCRSNLYKFLTGLLLDWDWNFQGDIDTTEEQAKYLEIIFKNQKDYKFWKQGLDVLGKEGKEKAWDWIKEQVPLLRLRNKLEGRE